MSNLPRKIRLLEIMNDNAEHWDHEVIQQAQQDYNMQNDYGRGTFNMELIELAAIGLIKQVDLKIDEGGMYRQGSLLHKYEITNEGKARLSQACMYAL